MTLEEIIKKHKLIFNTLIIDVEGYGFDFLKGNTLLDFEKIIIEFHENILGINKILECHNILLENNFIG